MTGILHIRAAEGHGLSSRQAVLILSAAWLAWAGNIPVALGQGSLLKGARAASLTTAQPTNLADSARQPGLSTQALQARLAEARANLAAEVTTEDASLTNTFAFVSPQDISLRRAGLRRLVHIYEQQLSAAAELETVKKRRAQLARDAQGWAGFAEPRPYSILLTDNLGEETQAERLRIGKAESALSVLVQLLEDNRNSLSVAEESIRQLNEQLESAKDAAATARLSWLRELERLRSQVSAATVAALDVERQIREEELAESRTRLSLLQRQLLVAEAGAKFTQADLDKVVARLEAEGRQLEGELAEAQTRQSAASRALETAREELRRVQGQPDTSASAAARATELAELRQAQMETADTAINALRMMIEAANTERAMWEYRFAAYDSRSVETLRQSERRLEAVERRVNLWKDYYRQKLEISSSQVALQEVRVNSLDPALDLMPLARERLATLRERDQFVLRLFRTIERTEHLVQRWGEGLQDAAGRLPFTGRVRNLFSDTRSFFKHLWNFELLTAEDTITWEGQQFTAKRSVTIGKAVLAILIVVAGYWITGLVARITERLIVKRLKIELNQAGLIRRWLRTLLLVCLVLFSLVWVKIPLTVFAFAGGALAIGLGFGMQTLLKNFVSGIIILFERPFRVGDVLDVAGQRGTVTGIGLRSSVLQLWDGTETLIPNSTLLENNLTNWTYSNRTVRFFITVGVAYGSDIRRVVQVLAEVAERHGLVEKDPKPQVLFTNFGESALNFELRFWVDVLRANAAQVSSDLRQMIAGAFAERGLVLAFPQRDLHLNTARPIQIQMTPGADRPTPPPVEGKPDGG